VTPFLNGMPFLGEAITCVLDQSLSSWELLLVDDGSTDGSSELSQGFADRFPGKVIYLSHPSRENKGQSASRNLALEVARGEFVAFLDADDFWLSDNLKKKIEIFDRHSDVEMVFGRYYLWFSWDKQLVTKQDIIGDIAGGIYDTPIGPPDVLMQHIRFENGLPAPVSAVIRRRVINRVGGFELSFPGMYDDEAFFAKIALNSNVYVTSECLDRYRQHSESFCAKAIRSGSWNPDPLVPSVDRLRLNHWLHRYVSAYATNLRSELLWELEKKIRELESRALIR
jgi:glycosyltransferase involved in cell wall biosynthesis